jgi:cell division septation protein DedD
MDSQLKQRLIGAAVLVALAVIFLPMLLKGPDVKEPDAAQVPLSMPATPGQEYETRELPLTEPTGAVSPGGVLGMTPAEPEALPAPEAPATVPAVASSVAATAPSAVATVAKPTPAPATPVQPPPAEPAAVAAGKYVVNIGSFSNLANANALAAKLRAQKLPVMADKVNLASGSAMRVRVGPYADRATAEAARLRAEEVTGAPGKVVASDASAADASLKPVASAPTKPESAKPETAKPEAPKPATPPAAPAAPAAPKPAPASAPATGFAVQLSAPSVEADAHALRDRARAQGLSAFVQPVETDSGRRYRVRVGPVADRAAAQALSEETAAKLGNKGIIVTNP